MSYSIEFVGTNIGHVQSVYEFKIIYENDDINVRIIYSPTGNCQVASIAFLGRLVSEFGQNSKEIVKKLMTEAGCSKTLLIFDVHEYLFSKVIDVFNVISYNKYKSTNDNNMILGVIKL